MVEILLERSLADMYHIGKNINTTSSCTGGSQGSISCPLCFSIYINDLPLSIQNSETDMYNTCESTQQSLPESLTVLTCLKCQ